MSGDDKGRLIGMRVEAAKTAAMKSMERDFREQPKEMLEIQTQFELAVSDLVKEGHSEVGGFVIAVIGNGERGMKGHISMGGSISTLMMLRALIDESVNETIHENGGCGCKTCFMQALTELVIESLELKAAQEEAKGAQTH